MAMFMPHMPYNLDEPMSDAPSDAPSDAHSDGNSTLPDEDFIHVVPSDFQPWRAEINRLALELTAERPVKNRTETERNHNRDVARITCNYQLVWLRECVIGIEQALPTGNVAEAPVQDFFEALRFLGPSQFIKWSDQVPKPSSTESIPPDDLLKELGMMHTRKTLRRALEQDDDLLEIVIKQLVLMKEVLQESPAPTLLSSLTTSTARTLYEHLRSRLDELPTLLPHI